jgi:hypothetical protein
LAIDVGRDPLSGILRDVREFHPRAKHDLLLAPGDRDEVADKGADRPACHLEVQAINLKGKPV